MQKQISFYFLFFFTMQGMLFGQSLDKDSLLYVLETSKTDSARVHNYVLLSREYVYTDLKLSLSYAEKSLDIAEKQDDDIVLAYALFNAGNVYFALGMYEPSSRFFYRYLAMKKEKGSKREIAFSLSNIGAIHLQMKQFEKAEPIFLSVLDLIQEYSLSEQGELLPEIVTIYNNLGIVYRELNDKPKAIDYYNRGIIIAQNLDIEDESVAMLYNNLGNVYNDIGDYPEAYNALQKALDLRKKNKNIAGMAASYRNLGNYYQSLQDFDQAKVHFYKAAENAQQVGGKSLTQSIFENLFEYYQALNRHDSALKYHILSKQLDEEMNAEATMRELTSLELNAQFAEKEKLSMEEQKRKEQWYFFIAVFLVMVLAIIALLFFLTKNRLQRLQLEKQNSDLLSKNLILEKETLEKELELNKKEMTTNVMYQIKKNELVDEIVRKLLKHSPNFRKENQELIRGIIRDLEKTQKDEVWDEFELRFQGVHDDFYNKLRKINPDLSNNERRLCAFLKLNMTTKEIASITGQSPRSIEVARTRLRKKLDLTNSDTSLTDFLLSI